jgi:ribosome-binding protein aMBF1 (putative translation factor)
MKNERIEKFLALVSPEISDFEKKALWRKENKNWLRKSSAIAIKVHSAIICKGISQKAFAEKMGVSAQYITKILKGNENLSLETISKLETALGIQLIEISSTNHYVVPQSIQPMAFNWTTKSLVVVNNSSIYSETVEEAA